MFRKINRLTRTSLTWVQDPNRERVYITGKYKNEECYIRMNDFPEEPLWTLFFKGESLDLEDTPTVWSVLYEKK
jgi:hypothetical protein